MNILFLAINIIDPDEIYITDIYRLPLTTGLSFIGSEVFGNFLPNFQILPFFFVFHGKKWPLKVNASQTEIFEFWRKQIMSKNQACDRLYCDKVSKF